MGDIKTEFGANPQDRFAVIDPTKYFPADFVPAYSDIDDANATLDAVAKDMQTLLQSGGTANQALNAVLGVLGTALGATKTLAL